MLHEYILMYIEAKRNDDNREMRRIERDLRQIGVDQATLNVLVYELSK